MGAMFTSCTRAAYWKVGLLFVGDDKYRFSALAAAPSRYNPVTRLQLALHAPPTPFRCQSALSLSSVCHQRYYSLDEYLEDLEDAQRLMRRKFVFLLGIKHPYFLLSSYVRFYMLHVYFEIEVRGHPVVIACSIL